MNKKKLKRILAMRKDGLDLKTCIQIIITLSTNGPLGTSDWIVKFLDEGVVMEIQEEITSIKAELEKLRPRLNKIQLDGARLATAYINHQKKADEIKQQIVDDREPAELELATTYTRLRRRLIELERQLHKQSPPWFTICRQTSSHSFSKMLGIMSEEDKSRLLETLRME